MGKTESVTQLLVAWQGGDTRARERLLPLVYDELRALARRHLRQERSGHTLQATDLVHEAWLRLGDAEMNLNDRVHFCSVASRVMRRVLVDHARARSAAKRGGGGLRVTLGNGHGDTPAEDDLAIDELLALDDALERLAALDDRKCRIVELVYFGGLEHVEIEALLEVSRTTVHRDLAFARAWLKRELGAGG